MIGIKKPRLVRFPPLGGAGRGFLNFAKLAEKPLPVISQPTAPPGGRE